LDLFKRCHEVKEERITFPYQTNRKKINKAYSQCNAFKNVNTHQKIASELIVHNGSKHIHEAVQA